MRKIALVAAAAASLCSLATYAASLPEQTSVPTTALSYSAFDGTYIGAAAGVTHMTNQAQMFDNGASDLTTVRSHAGTDRVTGMLFGGYGLAFNRYYVGGELFGRPAMQSNSDVTGSDVSTIDGSSSNSSFDRVQDKFSFGGAFKGGYILTQDVMAYALVGPDVTRFKSTVTDEIGTVSTFTDTKVGVLTGIGGAVAVASNVLLNMEYTYSFYSPIRHRFTDSADGDLISTKLTPYRGRFWVGASYLF